MPPEDVAAATSVVEASATPVLASSPVSLPADPTPIIAQAVAEQVAETTSEIFLLLINPLTHVIYVHSYLQVPVEALSVAAPELNSSAPPPVLDSSSSLASADPTPVLTQPVIEQLADAAPTAVEVLQVVATEPRLAELGLAGHTPVGVVQNLLEFMHIDLGLPWWGAIVVGKHG